jgi:REP-associated tyrosine transposase
MPSRRPPHLADDLYVGSHRIFLTMCTFRRRTLFVAPAIVNAVAMQFLQRALRERVEAVAYCFMPDHLHALVAGESEDSDLKQLITAFRQSSGYWYRQTTGNRLWQEGYFDRHLREDEDTFDVVSYIVANPVRGGLCASATEYPFSGSSRYALKDLAEFVQWRPERSCSRWHPLG